MALPPRHQRFVEEYLVEPNATQAWIKAGGSARSAESQGSRLLRNAKVAAAIAAGQKARADRLEVKADDVLREIQTFAHVDPGEMFDDNGALLPIKKMPVHLRRAIASFEVLEQTVSDGEGGEIVTGILKKVKLNGKAQGLEMLGKHLKLFTEKHEHDVGESLEGLLEKMRELEGKAK